MKNIGKVILLTALLIWGGNEALAEQNNLGRTLEERFLTQVDPTNWFPDTFRISPDKKRTAYVSQIDDQHFVVVDGIAGRGYEGILKGSLVFSPNSKRFAYIAKKENKQVVVVDGIEGKSYDKIHTNPIFTPDSQKFLYIAQTGDKVCVVVNGKEGKLYDEILNPGRGKINLESAEKIHYFARNGESIVFVQEKIE